MSTEPTTVLAVPLILGVVAGGVALLLALGAARRTSRKARASARRALEDARVEAEAKQSEILVAAQERALALEDEWERRERDIEARESALDSRTRELEQLGSALRREKGAIDRREAAVARSERHAHDAESEASRLRDEAAAALERVAGLTAAEAKVELIASVRAEAEREGTRVARKILDEARADAEREALDLLVQATERVPIREAVESMVAFVRLPSDEMKGRIIGREGRNIRALENATGIDLIIDDTPQAILISSFDPLRREVARVAIERLIEDGRIHPARIEEVVERVRTELDAIVEDAGTQAAFGLGISDLHPKLARRVGRLRFRTHHGHNLLQHCTEVALVAGFMAGEVGAREEVVHRAGLFHEIGRVDESVSGHTALASAELAAKYGEPDEVVHAIQALHPDVEPNSLEALLVQAANRISDNRPGARRDNLEIYIERLRRLESVATRYDGVERALAVKAGKEVRVIVDARAVDDDGAQSLSREIARALERELAYPGQIKVSVVRETRAVTFAV